MLLLPFSLPGSRTWAREDEKRLALPALFSLVFPGSEKKRFLFFEKILIATETQDTERELVFRPSLTLYTGREASRNDYRPRSSSFFPPGALCTMRLPLPRTVGCGGGSRRTHTVARSGRDATFTGDGDELDFPFPLPLPLPLFPLFVDVPELPEEDVTATGTTTTMMTVKTTIQSAMAAPIINCFLFRFCSPFFSSLGAILPISMSRSLCITVG